MSVRRPAGAAAALLLAVASVGGGCGGPRIGIPSSDPLYEFELGRAQFQRQHWLESQEHLKRFLNLNPGHAQADSAQFLVGMCLFRSKSYAEAGVEFSILAREYPRSDLRDDAGYYECLSQFEQKRPAQLDASFAAHASTCFNDFLLRFPETSYRGEAEARLHDIDDLMAEKQYRLGVLFVKLKKPEAARIYLQEVVATYPHSRWTAPALYWIARSHEVEGMTSAAAAAYRRLIDAFPDRNEAKEARARLQGLVQEHPELQSQGLQQDRSSSDPQTSQTPAHVDSSAHSRP